MEADDVECEGKAFPDAPRLSAETHGQIHGLKLGEMRVV